MHEVNVLDFLPIGAGTFYVMDRGYLDFARLYKRHQVSAFFVTRAKARDGRQAGALRRDRAGHRCDL
jgi:hypothetical protein